VKKGRHRRFEEARALKRSNGLDIEAIFDDEKVRNEPCPECGSDPGDPHASWCLADAEES
jgi:hypothetical protein